MHQKKAVHVRRISNALLILLLLCGGHMPLAGTARCQPDALQAEESFLKRLILTDGSYEQVSQYRIEGDRVRYFSTERHAWEELPCTLVDWPATHAYASQALQEASGRTGEALDGAAVERREEEARAPVVAPGIRLSSPDGVFLLDTYREKPELNRLIQSGGDLNRNTGSNILRGVINPIAGSRQTVELKGLRARIQSHVPEPSIYFPIDSADPLTVYDSRTAKDHLRLVRCEKKKGNRIVATISVAIYGKVRQQARYVEAKVEPVSDYWVKVSPVKPLETGEFALAEFDENGSMNLYVWDFGVNPLAPPNPAAEQAIPERPAPVLKERPQKKADP
jgi:hypothetical protein